MAGPFFDAAERAQLSDLLRDLGPVAPPSADFLGETSIPGPAQAADRLVMLRDGAMVSGYLSDPATVAGTLSNGIRAIMAFDASSPS